MPPSPENLRGFIFDKGFCAMFREGRALIETYVLCGLSVFLSTALLPSFLKAKNKMARVSLLSIELGFGTRRTCMVLDK